VILLARLAVDLSMRGRGLAAVLLFHALRRAAEVSAVSAAWAVIVDALHDRAKAFYQHYHFEESLDDPMRLFLPMHDIRTLLIEVKSDPS
jgi:GNAT superfamily N-acetyltransferase